jgi:hypothetical protein
MDSRFYKIFTARAPNSEATFPVHQIAVPSSKPAGGSESSPPDCPSGERDKVEAKTGALRSEHHNLNEAAAVK